MRDTNKVIIKYEQQSTEIVATKEELIYIGENKELGIVECTIHYKDVDGNVIGNEFVEITGEKYGLLMSASPSFAPSKPENEYREEDLWYIIDLIRTENAS